MKNNLLKYKSIAILVFLTIIFCQCQNKNADSGNTKQNSRLIAAIDKSAFGTTPEGFAVDKFVLSNKNGMQVEVITYGGIITSWTAPDKNGNYQNIVLGYGNLKEYLKESPYFGAIIGRYGNRIANGKFSLDGKEFILEKNNGSNHLHGGVNGFDKVIWSGSVIDYEDGSALKLTYLSKDGEGGYPGNLTTSVIYALKEDDSLEVIYEATTDKKTIVNLTQHSYFNLSGDFSRDILDHELIIEADSFLPVDAALIPTGEIRSVENTPFDFRKAKTIGKDINATNDQLGKGKGYDHCWVLNDPGNTRTVATAHHPASGRILEISTDQPGIQFYSGNFLNGTLPIPGGGKYEHRTGFCLETQHFPDSPNQQKFPSVILNPGETYFSRTNFKFSKR